MPSALSSTDPTPPSEGDRWSRRQRIGLTALAWMLGCVILPLLAVRTKRSVGGSNVDDYLYANLTLNLGSPFTPVDWLTRVLHTGSISPLVPALTSLTRLDATPYMSAVAQVAFLSLLFWSTRGIAMRLEEPHPTLWALTSSAFAAMIGWTTMFHFAVAASALLAAGVWAYLASQRLTKLGPTILLGCSLGALTLTRGVALVYVAAFCAAGLLDLLRQPRDRRTLRGLAIAGATAVLIAAPWWLLSGPKMIGYLLSFGYESSSGFADNATLLGRITDRVSHTLREWGWPVVATLVLLLILWIASVVHERGRPNMPAVVSPARDVRLMLLVLVGAGMVILASSTNLGTAFSLPFVPLLILAVASGSARLRSAQPPRRALSFAAILAAFTVGTSLCSTSLPVADAMRLSTSWHDLLHQAGWTEGDRGPEEVHRVIVKALEGRDVVVVRDDALLNVNGLVFTSEFVRRRLGRILTAPYGKPDWVPSESDLGNAIVIAGTSPANYHRLDSDRVAARLTELSYSVACEIRLGSANTVVLWAPSGERLACPT